RIRALHLFAAQIARGNHDHRGRPDEQALAHARQRCEAVHRGHHDVEQDHRELVTGDQRDRLFTGGRLEDPVAERFEQLPTREQISAPVVDHQDFRDRRVLLALAGTCRRASNLSLSCVPHPAVLIRTRAPKHSLFSIRTRLSRRARFPFCDLRRAHGADGGEQIRPIAASKSRNGTGFGNSWTSPNCVRTVSALNPVAVTIKIGMSRRAGSRSCSWRKSQPSITGNIKSRRMASGRGPPCSNRSASRPFVAVATWHPSSCNASRSESRTAASSSTSSSRGIRASASAPAPNAGLSVRETSAAGDIANLNLYNNLGRPRWVGKRPVDEKPPRLRYPAHDQPARRA